MMEHVCVRSKQEAESLARSVAIGLQESSGPTATSSPSGSTATTLEKTSAGVWATPPQVRPRRGRGHRADVKREIRLLFWNYRKSVSSTWGSAQRGDGSDPIRILLQGPCGVQLSARVPPGPGEASLCCWELKLEPVAELGTDRDILIGLHRKHRRESDWLLTSCRFYLIHQITFD